MSDALLDIVGNLASRGEERFETTPVPSAVNDTVAILEDYCYIPTELFEVFAATPFQNTDIIQWMHSIPPRFGKTSDVLSLILGTQEEQREYVLGLLASGFAILFFFLLWGALLLLFWCAAPADGSNYVRWLGGQPLRMPSPPLGSKKHFTVDKGESTEYQDWKHEFEEAQYQLNMFRTIVWIAGLSITISALVMSVYGVDSLTNTLEAGRESLGIVRKLAGDAESIVDSVIQQNEDLSSQVFGMLEDVNGMCPMVKDPLCDNVFDFATCDVSAFLGDDLNNVLKVAGNHFVEGEKSGYYQEIVNAKNGLQDVKSLSQDIDSSAAQLNWALTLSMIFSLLLAMLCTLILCGLVCPNMFRIVQCLRSKIMIPTFAVLVFFAYLFSMVFVTASVATADVCVYHNATSNVDERLLQVLTQSQVVKDLVGGEETQTLVGEFIGFYIHRCPVELLPQEILEQLEYVKVGAPVLQEFSTIVEQSTGLIQGVCGFAEDESQQLVDVADALQEQLCSMASIVNDVRDFIQCSNWFPLYETTVYEALCYDGTEGFAYVATTQFIIVFMAFVILTFRVAFWDIQVGDEYYDFVDDSIASEEENGTQRRQDEDGESVQYYRDLRKKVGIRTRRTEGDLEELRERQWREQEERQRVALVAARQNHDLHAASSSFLQSPTSTAATNLSSSFEDFEDASQESTASRQSSRFWNDDDLNIGGTFDGEDGGIEIEHVGSYNHGVIRSVDDRSVDNPHSVRSYPSRSVDATSLWVGQHHGNVDYENDDDNCSVGSLDVYWN